MIKFLAGFSLGVFVLASGLTYHITQGVNMALDSVVVLAHADTVQPIQDVKIQPDWAHSCQLNYRCNTEGWSYNRQEAKSVEK